MGEKSGSRIELSYVLPTYNRVEYLGECIMSLWEQDYPKDKYEIIVVDDGSTDSTFDLISHCLKEYKNLRYYKLKRGGVEKARNFGNKKAQGAIIGVCDSDDLYHQDRTKITLDYFKRHPEVDIMDGAYLEIDHRCVPIKYYNASETNKERFLSGGATYFCHDNCAYRKDKILKTPYRKGKEGTDDWKLVHDWLKAGYRFGFIDKELCMVRTLNNGIMGGLRKQKGIILPNARA